MCFCSTFIISAITYYTGCKRRTIQRILSDYHKRGSVARQHLRKNTLRGHRRAIKGHDIRISHHSSTLFHRGTRGERFLLLPTCHYSMWEGVRAVNCQNECGRWEETESLWLRSPQATYTQTWLPKLQYLPIFLWSAFIYIPKNWIIFPYRAIVS